MRGATMTNNEERLKEIISIHAPHAGSDTTMQQVKRDAMISIHAPHAGSDHTLWVSLVMPSDFNPRSPCGERPLLTHSIHATFTFQSTLPMRGATILNRVHIGFLHISIHAPHAGSDLIGTL